MTHTKGKLRVTPKNKGGFQILTEDGMTVVASHCPCSTEIYPLVALWNAFASIPNPEAIPKLVEALKKLDSWLVCAGITTAEDMAQSFPLMQETVSVALKEAGIVEAKPDRD